MQDPRPLYGLVFPNIKYYNKLNQTEGVVIAYADTADEGTDYFSMPVIKIIANKCYVIDVIFNQYNLDTNIPMMRAFVEKYSIDHLFIETNREGGAIMKLERKNITCPMIGIHNTPNKMQRIFAQASYIMEYFYFKENYELNSEYYFFIQQLLSLLKTSKKEDDAADSCAGTMLQIRVRFMQLLKN